MAKLLYNTVLSSFNQLLFVNQYPPQYERLISIGLVAKKACIGPLHAYSSRKASLSLVSLSFKKNTDDVISDCIHHCSNYRLLRNSN